MSFAASTYDVLAAVEKLRSSPGIHSTRIGATGGSRGGTAVMMAIAAPLSEVVLSEDRALRAVVAGYPWYGVQDALRKAQSLNVSIVTSQGASILPLQNDRMP
jgi:dienelactone hydrolase